MKTPVKVSDAMDIMTSAPDISVGELQKYSFIVFFPFTVNRVLVNKKR